ncbi:UNVERIFIED_CONTAM: hypothetical protein PYX00_004008 [Menopon gallinae]|uniref:Uncharacterized protein n=1 Tax=Menopon gallinae TaxID=328185 RepID=A0AAW2I419_9NEOP
MSKVILSFFLLMVLQFLLTEGNTIPRDEPKVCPPGTFADENGECTESLKSSYWEDLFSFCLPVIMKTDRNKACKQKKCIQRYFPLQFLGFSDHLNRLEHDYIFTLLIKMENHRDTTASS